MSEVLCFLGTGWVSRAEVGRVECRMPSSDNRRYNPRRIHPRTHTQLIPASYPTHPHSSRTHTQLVPDSYPTHTQLVPNSYPTTHPCLIPDSYPTHTRLYPTHTQLIPDSYPTHTCPPIIDTTADQSNSTSPNGLITGGGWTRELRNRMSGWRWQGWWQRWRWR